ncbi:uncharacterized protein LOC127809428 [Diospyros lotus]|uniref:uncharacterized protein LOC127809428 n=1 Tax=Diospyros lotus TaxID=55363 RepID=UPI00224CC7BA|nr:uncharacterized protein LOC127809428 [Diospyros lotus]
MGYKELENGGWGKTREKYATRSATAGSSFSQAANAGEFQLALELIDWIDQKLDRLEQGLDALVSWFIKSTLGKQGYKKKENGGWGMTRETYATHPATSGFSLNEAAPAGEFQLILERIDSIGLKFDRLEQKLDQLVALVDRAIEGKMDYRELENGGWGKTRVKYAARTATASAFFTEAATTGETQLIMELNDWMGQKLDRFQEKFNQFVERKAHLEQVMELN